MLGSSDIDPPPSAHILPTKLTSSAIPIQQNLPRPTSNIGEYLTEYQRQQQGWFAIRAGAEDRSFPSTNHPTMDTTTTTSTSTTTAHKHEIPQGASFDWQPELDYIDNEEQLQVIKHHYASEFGHVSSSLPPAVINQEFLEDYRNDCVVYSVLDEIPSTFRGLEGAQKSCESVASLLGEPHQISKDGNNNNKPAAAAHFHLKHISIKQNHAQVIWTAETASQQTILGTDSFIFDAENHIKLQTVVALRDK